MQLIADLHNHSRFSRATSKRINIDEISRFAETKGLSLVGTGDFTHPNWIMELEEDLSEEPGSGLYKSKRGSGTTNFIISCEVSSRGGMVVYDLIDEWNTSLGGDWYSEAVEQQIVEMSDIHVASAPSLVKRLEEASGRDALWIPNALPLCFLADSAIIASLGAVRKPFPTLSNEIKITACCQRVENERRTFEILDSP